MTKYGSFLTSLNGATGAIVGISSSLALPLLLISSSESPGIPEPLTLITWPFGFTNVIYLDTYARSLFFVSVCGPVSTYFSLFLLRTSLLYAAIAWFMVATVRSPCLPVLRVTWYSNLGPSEEDAAPWCGGTSPMSLPMLKCCGLKGDLPNSGLPRCGNFEGPYCVVSRRKCFLLQVP